MNQIHLKAGVLRNWTGRLTQSLRVPTKDGIKAWRPEAFSARALSTAVTTGETKNAIRKKNETINQGIDSGELKVELKLVSNERDWGPHIR